MSSAGSELVTRAEFARMRGVSRKTVTQWVAQGRVAIEVRDGRELIDPAAAAAALKSSVQRADEVRGLLLDDSAPIADDGDTLGEALANPSLTQLKARTESERSQLLKIERLEREGRLVSREEVEAEHETAARLVRRALDTIPSRAEDLLAAAKGGLPAMRRTLKVLMRDVERTLSDDLAAAAEELEARRAAEAGDASDD